MLNLYRHIFETVYNLSILLNTMHADTVTEPRVISFFFLTVYTAFMFIKILMYLSFVLYYLIKFLKIKDSLQLNSSIHGAWCVASKKRLKKGVASCVSSVNRGLKKRVASLYYFMCILGLIEKVEMHSKILLPKYYCPSLFDLLQHPIRYSYVTCAAVNVRSYTKSMQVRVI